MTGIDDSGHMAGNSGVIGANSQVVYWADKTSAPSGLGTNVVLPGGSGPFGLESGGACIGGDGSIIGGIDVIPALSGNSDIATFTPGGTPAYLYTPDPTGTSSIRSSAGPASKARGHWAGWYLLNGSGGTTTGAVVDGTQYPGTYVYAVNDSGVAIGNDSSGNAAIIATTPTVLGPGLAAALNNATVMSGTNIVAQPQIIGRDSPSYPGNPMLWDHTNLDGTTSSSYVGKNINKLIPATNGWSVTSVAAINNAGCIAGTANYSGTNSAIPAGQHGCLLVPCQFRLLNGDTNSADVDGMDFSGNRPTTISATSSYATSTLATNAIGAHPGGGNDGLDILGADPLGRGRSYDPILIGNECIDSLMMLAKVSPPAATNIVYGWGRIYQSGNISIAHTTTNTWYVTSAISPVTGQPYPTGVPTPENDTGDTNSFTTWISATNFNVVAYYDNPGFYVPAFTTNAPHVNDIVYHKFAFTYSLTNSIGSASAVATQQVGQRIALKRIATNNVVATDWTNIINTISTTNIPSPYFTTNEIKAIVSPSTDPIIFSTNVLVSP